MIRLKNMEQIEGLRRCGKLLAQMFEEIKPLVVPGATTGELDKWARSWLKKQGAVPILLGFEDKGSVYPAALCISINEEVIHGIPGKRLIREGDLVSIDTEIALNGLITDKTITFEAGRVDKEKAELNRVTRDCLWAGIAAAQSGQRIHQIARAVQGLAKEHHYGIVENYCGHGVGFEVHEDPSVPNIPRGPNPRLINGIVLAIEPMITSGPSGLVEELDDDWTVVTCDGRPASHWENTVAIVNGKTEVLTEL
jgi:methionyl aminopeptidase